jgi:hypothetical protein
MQTITTIGFDIAKSVFQVHGVDAVGQVQQMASYSITSSTRASSVGGTSRPSALAVLRLMTSSNLVGCSTGKSAGLPPCNTLTTNDAARRNESAALKPYDMRPPTSANDRGTVAAGRRYLSASSATSLLDKLPCTTTAPAFSLFMAANACVYRELHPY